MTIAAGTRFGPYEIISPAGAGGMGEVYRAKDTRLDRIVAVKVLPSALANHPEMRQRFEREAKTISTLSHPHICTLHDIGHQDGVDYLVLEYLEGETLEKRLEKGPLPTDEALKIAIELADALDKAHRPGIIHRDIKPGNIMLTKAGVKLMDFGLAKLRSDADPEVAAMTAMTVDKKKLTVEGSILGTFQYMAPEQLEGQEADARTDIFAFGLVLYEMATGRPAFSGKTKASLISAILSAQPKPISELVPTTPPALDRVIKRCLAKDPEDRWQTARDLMLELKWIAAGGGDAAIAAPAASAIRSTAGLAWIISAVLAVTLIAGAIWWRNSKPAEETMYFSAPLPFPARDIALSPNGHTVAVVAYKESARKNAIWVYELGSQGARNLGDTEGATYPFWSGDGKSLAFFADAKLKKLELAGGPVQTLCDAPAGRGGTWNRDGVIVFTPDALTGLYRVPASGGTPVAISNADISRGETSHRWPFFLPDGKHFLYLATNFAGTKGTPTLLVGALDSNERKVVVEATGNPAYAAPGYLLFYRDRTLLAQRFDLRSFGLTGEATTILSDVQFLPQVKRALYAVSDNGVLIAQSGSGIALSQPAWFDRKGNPLGVLGKPDVYGNIFLAPNGKSVAVDKTDMESQNIDLWTLEMKGESAKRLSFDRGLDLTPVWSEDGARLAYSSNQQLIQDIYLKNSDGTQEGKSIVHDEFTKMPNSWSRDGKYILYTRGTDLWYVTLPEIKPIQFLKAVSSLRNAQFSPDGKWVAYASNETGKWEIYATSFPEAQGKWQISTGGGEQPRWRGDGKELFYLSPDGKMMAAPVTTGARFSAGTPTVLFQASPRQPVTNGDLFVYDVSRDGQRFLINTPVKQTETAPMSVILNWTAKLNK
jgi:Tol biopolymer transport system component